MHRMRILAVLGTLLLVPGYASAQALQNTAQDYDRSAEFFVQREVIFCFGEGDWPGRTFFFRHEDDRLVPEPDRIGDQWSFDTDGPITYVNGSTVLVIDPPDFTVVYEGSVLAGRCVNFTKELIRSLRETGANASN